MTERISGLYAITRPSPQLEHDVAAALRGGARLVQYRNKDATDTDRTAQGRALARLCAQHHACLIVNDDPALALSIGAAGVHLGRDDTAITAARALLGRDALIGVSCYNELARAHAAVAAGADYVAFGSFYPSPTKPAAVRASIDLLREAKRVLPVPVVAIGGISVDNGAALVAAGADALAVIEGLFAQLDIEATARAYTALFARSHD